MSKIIVEGDADGHHKSLLHSKLQMLRTLSFINVG